MIVHFNFWFYSCFTAIECPPAPTFEEDSVTGEENFDYVDDKPLYNNFAQYTCPEGHTFEIFASKPNSNGTHDLLEDIKTINLTCSDYGDWMPLKVPKCIRKFDKSLVEVMLC